MAGQPPVHVNRVASIDILRGVTMLVMIFVNDLAGVKGLPWWNYHMPGRVNGMTYVDMVFPFFLFIVGMSIPLSVRHRLGKGTLGQLWMHTLERTAGLLVLGIALANVDRGDARLMGISSDSWGLLVLVGAVLFFHVPPKGIQRPWISRALKIAGLVLMVAMFAIFRRVTRDGDVRWLSFGYWEILGLIGWTYLAVCILYIPTRRWRWAPLLWFLVLCGLNVGAAAGWFRFAEDLPFSVWPWNNGCFGAITMAGVICTQLSLEVGFGRYRDRAASLIGFAAALLAAGWLLRPLGISKIRATPTWALWSAGAAVLLFCLVHWIADVRGKEAWAKFTKAAGENTLLTYLLPDMFYFGVSMRWLPVLWQSGAAGAVKALVFTGVMLGAATLLTNWRVRLAL